MDTILSQLHPLRMQAYIHIYTVENKSRVHTKLKHSEGTGH